MRLVLLAFLISISNSALAGPYLDLGIGYVDEVPAQATSEVEANGSVILRQSTEASISLNSPLLLFRGGYEYNGVHFEYEVKGFGEGRDHSLSTAHVYYRFRF